jgi:hypothetical protein
MKSVKVPTFTKYILTYSKINVNRFFLLIAQYLLLFSGRRESVNLPWESKELIIFRAKLPEKLEQPFSS